MLGIKEVIKSTTLKEQRNLTSDLLTKIVYETDICKCGNEYDAAYTLQIPTKVCGYMTNNCHSCEQDMFMERRSNEIAKENAEIRQKNIENQFSDKSLLNEKLKLATFENYQPTNEELSKAKAVCQRYANNFKKDNQVGLLLIGNYGTGKSHLGVSMAKELIAKGISSIFISSPKLLSLLRSTYNKSSKESEEDVMKRLVRVDCLVLDDIGAEQTKKRQDENEQDWATSKLFELIDSRIGKHTIYTSNFKPNELQERLGGRNFSRMMEGIHVVKMNGDDYRLKEFK